VRQKAVCGCLVEASRKSGERVAFQSLREEGGQKREEVQAARSPAIPDRGWSGTAHANLGARELGLPQGKSYDLQRLLSLDSSEPDVSCETLTFPPPPASFIANCRAIGHSDRLSAIPPAIIRSSDIVHPDFPPPIRLCFRRSTYSAGPGTPPTILRLFCAASGLRLYPNCLSYLTYDPTVTDLL